MPSLRVLAVVLLVGMGASVAAVSGVANSDKSDAIVRGSQAADPAVTPTVPPAVVPLDVRAENRLPGTQNWQIGRARGTRGTLAGYTRVLSVRSGQQVPLSVSGDGPVRVRAMRIGWYGGVGARQVWQGTIRAQREPGDPGTWPSRGYADTTAWPEGHYLLRLDQGDASRYLPLTVRTTDNRGRAVVLTSPLTWQAENTPAAPVTTAPAALPKISFNRPYATGFGAAGFLEHDARIVQLAERSGLSIGYATDDDVATDPALLTGATAVLTGGDSQYWTSGLRTAIRSAADAGTNLAFFGAGTGARQIKVVDAGRALQISRAAPSTSIKLTGLRPNCTGASTGWVVRSADWWGYRGTGLRNGSVLTGLVSDRADRPGPATTGSLLSLTPLTCGSVPQSGLYQVRASGAGVFTAGTGRWSCALTGRCTDASGRGVAIDVTTQRAVTRITRNVIKSFAKAKAGARLPVPAS